MHQNKCVGSLWVRCFDSSLETNPSFTRTVVNWCQSPSDCKIVSKDKTMILFSWMFAVTKRRTNHSQRLSWRAVKQLSINRAGRSMILYSAPYLIEKIIRDTVTKIWWNSRYLYVRPLIAFRRASEFDRFPRKKIKNRRHIAQKVALLVQSRSWLKCLPSNE